MSTNHPIGVGHANIDWIVTTTDVNWKELS